MRLSLLEARLLEQKEPQTSVIVNDRVGEQLTVTHFFRRRLCTVRVFKVGRRWLVGDDSINALVDETHFERVLNRHAVIAANIYDTSSGDLRFKQPDGVFLDDEALRHRFEDRELLV